MQLPRATSVRISVRRIVRTKDGRTVYVHQGDVYDGNGYKVGYVNPYDDGKCIGTVWPRVAEGRCELPARIDLLRYNL